MDFDPFADLFDEDTPGGPSRVEAASKRGSVSGSGNARQAFTDEIPSIHIRDIYSRGRWLGDGIPIVREGRFPDDGAGARIAMVASETGVDCVITVTSLSSHSLSESTRVNFFWQVCNFGGERPRFHCQACGRRADELFLLEFNLVCRGCAKVSYRSQWKSSAERNQERARAIRARFGGPPDMDAPFPERPKGMHWGRYDRLREEALTLEEEVRAEQKARALKLIALGRRPSMRTVKSNERRSFFESEAPDSLLDINGRMRAVLEGHIAKFEAARRSKRK